MIRLIGKDKKVIQAISTLLDPKWDQLFPRLPQLTRKRSNLTSLHGARLRLTMNANRPSNVLLNV